MGIEQAQQWSAGLRALKPMSLVVLDLSNCNIPEAGMAMLLNSVRSQVFSGLQNLKLIMTHKSSVFVLFV